MKQQKLLSLIRQAIEEYHMLEDGDTIVWCYTCNGLGADVGDVWNG